MVTRYASAEEILYDFADVRLERRDQDRAKSFARQSISQNVLRNVEHFCEYVNVEGVFGVQRTRGGLASAEP